MISTQMLETILKSDALPTLPVVAAKILTVADNDEVELEEIATLISQDASLATRILRVANSPLYRTSVPVGTVSKAVGILGINSVRSLVLSFSLLQESPSGGNPSFDHQVFWEHSLACAVTARWLLEDLGSRDVEEGLIAGLLANIGEMLMALACPQEYAEIMAGGGARGTQGPCPSIEKKVLGVDHGRIGAEFARRWNLPASLQAVMRHHHTPGSLSGEDDELQRLVAVVHLGSILADMFHSPEPKFLQELFLRRSRELLGLGEEIFQSLAAGVHEEVNRAADYFGVKVALDRSIEEILQEANLKLGQISLTYEQMNRELIATKMELFRVNRDLQRHNETLQAMADRDGLTGAYNHQYFQRSLQTEISRAERHSHPVSLILFDVDDFRAFNDAHGHQAGDQILKGICQICLGAIREYDLLARYGGEEFAIVLPQTDLAVARQVAERIRRQVEEHPFPYMNKVHRITVSLGVSCRLPLGLDHTRMIHLADRALSQAKKAGKNRVEEQGLPPEADAP